MSRLLTPKCKQCRREGKKLFLKGDRCYGVKCAMVKRPYAPGQHGQARRMRVSEYCLQLREKQKVKRMYGILEKQFRSYYTEAARTEGRTGDLLVALLERRLDNIVYRAGFTTSRNQARQLVNHGHFLVNGKKVDIVSYMIKEGDVVSVKNLQASCFQNLAERMQNVNLPSWMSLDEKKMEVKINAVPAGSDVDLDANIHLVIEYYAKI